MRIAILGAGAMGSLFGARLTLAGEEVEMVEVSPAQIEAIRTRGLRLETDEADRTVRVKIAEAHAVSGACELVIVLTKGMHTRSAIRNAAHLIGPHTFVLTVQNGLGNAETIAETVAADRVLVGMTTWPADLRAPGHVASHGAGEIRIWTASRRADGAVGGFAAVLDAAGLNCRCDPHVEIAIWEKVAFNAALNAICAATGLTVGSVGDSDAGRRLADAVVSETLAVATARGLDVSKQRVTQALRHAFTAHRDHKPSMLQDVLAGRQTEIDWINGAVVRGGEAAGLTVATTQVLADLVRMVEDHHRPMAPGAAPSADHAERRDGGA
ncbi:MAG: 2-dehydropantoate 2-reductase [Xanthobacteraceae bacterium]|nr:2-dehydropantoate 2-reductase [Xanthobacteraceae bacterium]